MRPWVLKSSTGDRGRHGRRGCVRGLGRVVFGRSRTPNSPTRRNRRGRGLERAEAERIAQARRVSVTLMTVELLDTGGQTGADFHLVAVNASDSPVFKVARRRGCRGWRLGSTAVRQLGSWVAGGALRAHLHDRLVGQHRCIDQIRRCERPCVGRNCASPLLSRRRQTRPSGLRREGTSLSANSTCMNAACGTGWQRPTSTTGGQASTSGPSKRSDKPISRTYRWILRARLPRPRTRPAQP
jgi:hypothetical protein